MCGTMRNVVTSWADIIPWLAYTCNAGQGAIRNKKLLGTSASLLVTSALLVVTRSY